MTIVKIQVVTSYSRFCANMAGARTFQNLNFEQATIVYDPSSGYDSAVYASDAIPGWIPNSFLGANDILYNVASIGSASVSILGTNGTLLLLMEVQCLFIRRSKRGTGRFD